MRFAGKGLPVMKWSKSFLALAMLLVLIPLSLRAQPPAEHGANIIYLLDVSKSMKAGGLFENIKEKLKELVRERHPLDRIVLITFGEKVNTVLDREIHSSKDIEDITRQIGSLRAEEDWTWMSKAFEETKEKARHIKSQFPGKKLDIYLLTDCENDPPPHLQEFKWKFIEVLTKHFKEFRRQEATVYLLAYRPLDMEEKQKIKAQTPLLLMEPSKAQPLPRIVLEISGFNWGVVKPSQRELSQKGKVKVTKMEGVTRDSVKVTPGPKFKISPRSFDIREVGQSVPLTLTIPPGLTPGKYTEVIELRASEAILEPNRIEATFEVAYPPKEIAPPPKTEVKTEPVKESPKGSGKIPAWLLLPLLLALLGGGGWLLFRKFAVSGPSRTIWIETEDMVNHPATLTGKKLFLGRTAPSPNLDLRLPRYYVTLNKDQRILLGDTQSQTENEVEFDKVLVCLDGEGKQVKLKFLDREPRPEDPLKSQEAKDLPEGFKIDDL